MASHFVMLPVCIHIVVTWKTFTCFKSTLETLEKCVKIFSKLTNTGERRQSCRSGVCLVNFEHITYLFLVFLLLTLDS